jgi:hypothetical protein
MYLHVYTSICMYVLVTCVSICAYASSVGTKRLSVKSTYVHILYVYASICKYMNVYERMMVYETENAHFAVSLPLAVGCTPLHVISWSASVRRWSESILITMIVHCSGWNWPALPSVPWTCYVCRSTVAHPREIVPCSSRWYQHNKSIHCTNLPQNT